MLLSNCFAHANSLLHDTYTLVALYGHAQVMAESTSLEVCLSTGVRCRTWCVSGSWRCHDMACVRVTSPGSFASRMAASARYSAGQYSLPRSIIITCIAFVYIPVHCTNTTKAVTSGVFLGVVKTEVKFFKNNHVEFNKQFVYTTFRNIYVYFIFRFCWIENSTIFAAIRHVRWALNTPIMNVSVDYRCWPQLTALPQIYLDLKGHFEEEEREREEERIGEESKGRRETEEMEENIPIPKNFGYGFIHCAVVL